MVRDGTRAQSRLSGYEQTLRARFQDVTGVELSNVRVLPQEFLRRPAPAPAEILSRLAVAPRTANLLRRHLAHHRTDGSWTCGRLLAIRGFGLTALLDVLSARRVDESRGGAARASSLHDEIRQLLGARARPSGHLRTPVLDRALSVIQRSLPATEAEIQRKLLDEGLSDGHVDVQDLERAVRFLEREPPFAVLRRESFAVVVPHERLSTAALVLGLATRAMVNWGLAPVRYIAFQARCADMEFVVALLAAKETFRWIHKPLGWFWFESPRSRLVQAIEKVLSLGRSVRLADLARSLFRRWPPEVIPPLLVLRELCRHLPQVVLTGNTVRLATPRPPASFTQADHDILSLFRDWGPRIDGFRLPFISQKLGLGAEALRRFLRSSFWVVERQPGVFQLIGT